MEAIDFDIETERLRRAVERQLASRLEASVTLDRSHRCARPEDNLVGSLSAGPWSVIKPQLEGGDGGELKTGRDEARPKFCSAFSSSALAVNAFGPLVERPALRLADVGVLVPPAVFEGQRTAGTRGYKPNLDVVFEPPDHDWVYVESKCLEYLRPHGTAFSRAYVIQAERLLAKEAVRACGRLFDALQQHDGYRFLDVAQLLKHFLAAKLAAAGCRHVTLLYVFWEPMDAGDHPVFARHRSEAQRLAAELADEEVRLVPISYPALWAAWRDVAPHHSAALIERYGIAMTEIRG
jgi:hypothetical protein